MFLLVCVLAGLSYGLTLLYVDIDNFENQVNLADATSVWGASVSGTPGVSWLSTLLPKVQLIVGVCRLYCQQFFIVLCVMKLTLTCIDAHRVADIFYVDVVSQTLSVCSIRFNDSNKYDNPIL